MTFKIKLTCNCEGYDCNCYGPAIITITKKEGVK